MIGLQGIAAGRQPWNSSISIHPTYLISYHWATLWDHTHKLRGLYHHSLAGIEHSWVDLKQALEKLELDQASGLNNPTSEAAAQEPHQPPRPVVKSATELRPVYFWVNGRLQAQDQQEYHEVCKRRFRGVSMPCKVIRFFIRHPLDPTGSCFPSFQILKDTLLEEVFDWYLSETYEQAPGGGVLLNEDRSCWSDVGEELLLLGDEVFGA